jgi:tetratricopeptide (TPR) repeat protein
MGEFTFGWMQKKLELGAMGMRAEMNLNSAFVDLGNDMDAPLGYQKLILKNQHQVNRLLDEATSFIRKDNIKKAVEILDKCLSLNPEVPQALILKGKHLMKSKKYQSAYNLFDKATKINNSSEEAWMLKGIMLLGQLKVKEAIECLNIVLRINPFHQEAISMISKLKKN